jgi:hypothetical protein
MSPSDCARSCAKIHAGSDSQPQAPPSGETALDRRRRLAGLHEKAQRHQWSPTADLDWNQRSGFGSRLPEDFGFARESFRGSPLSRYGSDVWTRFRCEFQSWMISQFLPGEQAAMLASSRLVGCAPNEEARLCLAGQAADEARHVDVFSRYIREKIPHPYPTSHALGVLLQRATAEQSWDISVLALHVVVEALALPAFRLGSRTFDEPLIRSICARVACDEGRHVAIGMLCLRDLYPKLTPGELRYREDYVIEAAYLVRQQFLFDEIWDRMGLPCEAGRTFAITNRFLIEYRQIICSKLVSALGNIGLFTPRLQEQLRRLDLLGERQLARVQRASTQLESMDMP